MATVRITTIPNGYVKVHSVVSIGVAGKSAYEIAVQNGFVGTQAQWLASLGTNATGVAGKSAYQVAVSNGFVGTEVQWLASLKGAKGDTGAQGPQGPQGLQGPKGDAGAQGEMGPQGLQGPQGLKGNTGNTGAQGPQGIPGETGPQGAKGDTGAQGVKGDTGATGPKGDKGDTGNTGAAGTNGWTPVLSIVSDGERRVQQVVDWTGGSGTKPTTGQYVGASGLTATLASAVDIRGAAGAGGAGTAGNLTQASGTANLGLTTTEAQVLSATITPSSTTAKIVVMATIDATKDTGTTVRTVTARIRRGTANTDTQVGVDSIVSSQGVASSLFGPNVIVASDVPGVTTAVTYTLRALASAALNANRYSLTVFEVATKGDTGATGAAGTGGAIATGTFTSAFDFTTDRLFDDYTQTGNITLSLASVTHVPGKVISGRIIPNGTGTFTAPASIFDEVYGDAFSATKYNRFTAMFKGNGKAVLTLTNGATVGAGGSASTKYINIGATGSTTINSVVFEPGSTYQAHSGIDVGVGGEVSEVAATTFDTLYHTLEYSFNTSYMQYNVPVSAGNYTVYLHLRLTSDTNNNPPGWLQDHIINGVTVESNVSIYTLGGSVLNKAVVRSYNVTQAATGNMTIRVQQATGKVAIISGIEIVPQGQASAIPLS